MALTNVALYGTAASKTLGNTLQIFSPASPIPVGRVLVCAVAADNTATSDGPSTSVSGVTGSFSGPFIKAGEYTNDAAGAATGATISVWYKYITTAINAGDDSVTVTFASNIVAKVACVQIMNATSPNFTLEIAQGVADDVDPPVQTISGLTSQEHLFIRAVALEAGTNSYTPSTNYTGLGTVTTNAAGDSTDISLGWEYRIFTGTGDTTNPTMGSPQSASLYMAFKEFTGAGFVADKLTINATAIDAALSRTNVSPVVASSTNGTYASTAGPTVTLPAGTVQGDLLVMFLGTVGSITPTLPAGWTLVNTLANGTTASDPRVTLYAKFAGASEPNVAVTMSATGELGVSLLRITGASASVPLNANSNSTGTGSSVSLTQLTTTVPNCLLIDGITLIIGSSSGTSQPAGFTLIADQGVSVTALNDGYKVQSAAGASGTITATITNGTSSKWAAQMLAIAGSGVASYTMPATTNAIPVAYNNAGLASSASGGGGGGTTTFTTKTYTHLTTEIANPERGWCVSPNASQVPSWYTNYRNGADKITVFRHSVELNAFKGIDITQAFLDGLNTRFANIRAGGAKMCLRFSYDQSSAGADTDKPTILRHIDQLTPLLQAYSDILMVWEAGFIGGWGEWAYSANFGIIDSSKADYGLTVTQWADRKAVADKMIAVLKTLPHYRYIALRTPNFFYNMYGSSAVSDANRHSTTVDTARIGQINDAFVANNTDFGTYRNTAVDYPWLAQQTKWTIMGGESEYQAGNTTRQSCPTATSEMAQFHWTYCNNTYNMNTVNQWISGGCYDAEMSLKLGYRLYLTQAVLPDNIYSGSVAHVTLTLVSEGYAAPVSYRPMNLVLKNLSTLALTRIPFAVDPRDWVPGTYTIDQNLQLPTLASGSYACYIELPDQASNLASNPLYSIQLANVGTWDSTTGFNNLNHTTIASVATPGAYSMAVPSLAINATTQPAVFQYNRIFTADTTVFSANAIPTQNLLVGKGFAATTATYSVTAYNITSNTNLVANLNAIPVTLNTAAFQRTYNSPADVSNITVNYRDATLFKTGIPDPGGGGGGGSTPSAANRMIHKFQQIHQQRMSEQRKTLAGTHVANATKLAAQQAAKQAEAKRIAAKKRKAKADIKDLDEEIQAMDEMLAFQPQFKIHTPALEQIAQSPQFAPDTSAPQRAVYTNPAIQDDEQSLEMILLNIL